MKGKSFGLKIVLSLLIILTAGVFVGIEVAPKSNSIAYAAPSKVTLYDEEYSAYYNDNVLFSVEKVAVRNTIYKAKDIKKDSKNHETKEVDVPSVYEGDQGENRFLGFYDENEGDDVIYEFKDLPTETSSKTVVGNSQFAVLNNQTDGSKFYISDRADEQEAVMVSFGAYVNLGHEVVTASDDIHSGITYLDVKLEKNGVLQELTSNRNIVPTEGGLYFDFVYLITQRADNLNEGYYKFTFKYMYQRVEYNEQFEFYVVNNLSYNKVLDSAKGYNAHPTLGWTQDGENFAKTGVSEYEEYFIGSDGLELSGNKILSYPTITYDYTKYKLSYTHTAYNRNTSYTIDVKYEKKSLTVTTATLVYTKVANEIKETEEILLSDYNPSGEINLVTILLTEPGYYVANYDYLYTGYNADIAPELDIDRNPIKLHVGGFVPKYSKTGTDGASLQYFELATGENPDTENEAGEHIDIVVPFGYELADESINDLEDAKLGFVYKFVDSELRAGDVLYSNKQDALINHDLKIKGSYDFLSGNLDNYFKKPAGESFNSGNRATLESVLSSINYVETNQGSLWIEGNDEFAENSIYFYSPAAISFNNFVKTDADGNPIDNDKNVIPDGTNYVLNTNRFTNETSFNAKGYYLVFVNVKISSDDNYWQVYAMKYNSSSVNINIAAVDEENETVIAGGEYTKHNVKISYLKPGIFDRAIKGFYYSALEQNLSREEMLEKQKKLLSVVEVEKDGEINYQTELGSDVAKGSFVKYLIKIESEGDTATYKTFTIDRQDISGVKPYLVQERFSGNSIFYSYDTDRFGDIREITNAITDSFATIYWDEKKSGAKISATYSYTPFYQEVADENKISGTRAETWISTNYALGNTIDGVNLNKSYSQYDVPTDCILFNQGLYIIHIKDSAGNECYYSFIIDQTENFFEIKAADDLTGDNAEILTNSYVVYGGDVKYTIGDRKVFELDLSKDLVVKDYVEKAAAGNLSTFKENLYYKYNSGHLESIQKYFIKVGGTYYFAVQNKNVVGYTMEDAKDSDINEGTTGTLIYDVTGGRTYYKRNIYAIAENQTYSTHSSEKSGAYMTIEINKDNAKGYVYHGTSQIETEPKDTDVKAKIETSSDGITWAHATSANNVAFAWTMGSGDFEVVKVYYSVYKLNPSSYFNDTYCFYASNVENTITIYDNGWVGNNYALTDGRALYPFNGNEQSVEGLYVVTREYKDSVTDEALGEDERKKNYYFIVDRNGIIDISQGIGSNIKINLLENEVPYDNFTTQGSTSSIFSYSEDGLTIDTQRYSIYLSSTKLPAVMNIPVGKYYLKNEESSDKYYAGRLNVQVFYRDIASQIYSQNADLNPTYKIYDSKYYEDKNKDLDLFGIFSINIYDYLTNVDMVLRDKITLGQKSTGEWLFLPGDYIIRISDNVTDTLGVSHVKYIGLNIPTGDKGPTVDVQTGYEENNTNKAVVEGSGSFKYTATVSQEYLNVVLPKYDSSVTNRAQVDDNYLIVMQHYNNQAATYYVNHPYYQVGGIGLDNPNLVTNENGNLVVKLDTKLRVNGEIDRAGFSKPLYYTVTVRYKIGTAGADEKYKNCYVYYENGDKKAYYEATYTIVIDREAPYENINALHLADALANDYVEKFETTSMFEDAYHATASNIYFTKQYARFYQEEKANNEYIYAYQASPRTPFNSNGINKVYHRQLSDDLSDLKQLPPINLEGNGYTLAVDAKGTTYGAVLGSVAENAYYEILEQDAAGNTTQYVIHYNPSNVAVNIYVDVKDTSGNEVEGVKLGIDENTSINIFEIKTASNQESQIINEKFVKIEIKNLSTQKNYTILTTAATDYEKLEEQIVDILNGEEYGNFSITIAARKIKIDLADTNYIEARHEINLYDTSVALDVDKLVEKIGENKYQINLHGANVKDNSKQLWYFANSIIIKSVQVGQDTVTMEFTGSLNEAGNVEYKDNDGLTRSIIPCEDNTTYFIEMTDVFDNVKKTRFNTSGREYYQVLFQNYLDKDTFGDYYSIGNDGVDTIYYGYTTAKINYDPIFNAKVSIKKDGRYGSLQSIERKAGQDGFFEYVIEVDYNSDQVLEYIVYLYEGDVEERHYKIVIDTRLCYVALRDYNSGEPREIIDIFHNIEYDDIRTRADESGSGRMNLYWETDTISEINYFDYTITLHELKKGVNNGLDYYVAYDLTGLKNRVISTESDSRGIYKFEVKVFNKEGIEIGNRIYSFEVQEVGSQIYYVRNALGESVLANSSFRFKDDELTHDGFKEQFEALFGNGLVINQNISISLYITNEDLTVVKTNDDVKQDSKFVGDLDANGYVFTLYKFTKLNAFTVFVGVLKVQYKETLVQNVSVNNSTVGSVTSFTIPGEIDTSIHIRATLDGVSGILAKNELYVEVYYNDEFVKKDYFNGGIIEIVGNGPYKYVIKDLAGNVHKYENETTQLDVYALREVPILINGQAPIEHGFYNEDVILTIYNSTRYLTGSVEIKAEKNGEPYEPKGYNPYAFSEFGTYRVTITADYQDPITQKLYENITKVVTFTIINVREARKSLDLTSISGSRITRVINPYGEDKTTEFLNMLNDSNNGLNITYANVIDKSKDLNITAGKLTFTMTYVYDDYVYPTRTTTFSFTLNNETPKIECSLKKGDSTTKNFKIYFNPAIIYEQIGEAYIRLNKDDVIHIDEHSANREEKYVVSYKKDGDGDYYVQLVSASGIVWDSYKVTIKEPLNFWAIIVIIVVVGVVATVTITIIVLRRKMRIR